MITSILPSRQMIILALSNSSLMTSNSVIQMITSSFSQMISSMLSSSNVRSGMEPGQAKLRQPVAIGHCEIATKRAVAWPLIMDHVGVAHVV